MILPKRIAEGEYASAACRWQVAVDQQSTDSLAARLGPLREGRRIVRTTSDVSAQGNCGSPPGRAGRLWAGASSCRPGRRSGVSSMCAQDTRDIHRTEDGREVLNAVLEEAPSQRA